MRQNHLLYDFYVHNAYFKQPISTITHFATANNSATNQELFSLWKSSTNHNRIPKVGHGWVPFLLMTRNSSMTVMFDSKYTRLLLKDMSFVLFFQSHNDWYSLRCNCVNSVSWCFTIANNMKSSFSMHIVHLLSINDNSFQICISSTFPLNSFNFNNFNIYSS